MYINYIDDKKEEITKSLRYGVPLVISRICNKKMMNSLIKYYEEKRDREIATIKHS